MLSAGQVQLTVVPEHRHSAAAQEVRQFFGRRGRVPLLRRPRILRAVPIVRLMVRTDDPGIAEEQIASQDAAVAGAEIVARIVPRRVNVIPASIQLHHIPRVVQRIAADIAAFDAGAVQQDLIGKRISLTDGLAGDEHGIRTIDIAVLRKSAPERMGCRVSGKFGIICLPIRLITYIPRFAFAHCLQRFIVSLIRCFARSSLDVQIIIALHPRIYGRHIRVIEAVHLDPVVRGDDLLQIGHAVAPDTASVDLPENLRAGRIDSVIVSLVALCMLVRRKKQIRLNFYWIILLIICFCIPGRPLPGNIVERAARIREIQLFGIIVQCVIINRLHLTEHQLRPACVLDHKVFPRILRIICLLQLRPDIGLHLTIIGNRV